MEKKRCTLIFAFVALACLTLGTFASEPHSNGVAVEPAVQEVVQDLATSDATVAAAPATLLFPIDPTQALFGTSTAWGCGPSCDSASDCYSYCSGCSARCEEDGCPWQESDGGTICSCICH